MTSRQATFSPRPSRCPSRNAGTAPDLRPRARQKAGASWLSRRAPEGKPHDPPAGCGASTDGLRPRPQGTQEGDAPEHPSPHSPNAQRPGQAWLVMDGNRARVFQHRDPASQDSTRAGCATLPSCSPRMKIAPSPCSSRVRQDSPLITQSAPRSPRGQGGSVVSLAGGVRPCRRLGLRRSRVGRRSRFANVARRWWCALSARPSALALLRENRACAPP
jgi:hypothetical protein